MGALVSILRPSEQTVRAFVACQVNAQFSYSAVGLSKGGDSPADYRLSHRRVLLGQGAAVYGAACAAFRRWEMFNIGWVELCWPNAPIVPGTAVGVLIYAGGLWTLNAARIVYTIEEANAEAPIQQCYGFAYGTVPDHAERGEERFRVEWHVDNNVWYDLLAYSQPSHWIAKLGGPVTRYFQHRFGTDSLKAMQRAVCEMRTAADTTEK